MAEREKKKGREGSSMQRHGGSAVSAWACLSPAPGSASLGGLGLSSPSSSHPSWPTKAQGCLFLGLNKKALTNQSHCPQSRGTKQQQCHHHSSGCPSLPSSSQHAFTINNNNTINGKHNNRNELNLASNAAATACLG